MAQWYVKELSQLTQVSVQTLHHYDRIDLLKPSVRLPNGYRLYSENDLLKLQQIIALKFFGFELAKIKLLLSKDIKMIDHLENQSHILTEQANTLLAASQTLKDIIHDCGRDNSIPWENIIKSIEVYRMIKQLEKSWEGKVFNSDELKRYAHFEQEKKKISPEKLQTFKTEWGKIINEVNSNLSKNPESEFGIMIGQRAMEIVNNFYGTEYADIRNAVWNKGFKEGQIDHEHPISPECFKWLDKAMSAYYMGRIIHTLGQAEVKPYAEVSKEWDKLLTDMYGNQSAPKMEIHNDILNSNEHSQSVKNFIQKYMEENTKNK